MGCHGSPTCQMEFEGATGWLIGEENRGHANPNPNPNPNPDRNPNRNPDPNQENRGLNHMFTFINTSRVGTAVQGVAAAEAAFQNSLWYVEAQGQAVVRRGLGLGCGPPRLRVWSASRCFLSCVLHG